MNDLLFKAILSMDSYNRGYNPGIKFGDLPSVSIDTNGTQIGSASVIASSTAVFGTGADSAIGFYAIAYDVGGETVISYRGTDNLLQDGFYGYGVATGFASEPQADLAFAFYNTVSGGIDPRDANISLVGANDNYNVNQSVAA